MTYINLLLEYYNNRVNTVLTNKNINMLISVGKIVCLFHIISRSIFGDDIMLSNSHHNIYHDISHANV